MAEEVLTADELAQFDEDVGFAIEGLGVPSRSTTYTRVSVMTSNVTSGAFSETTAAGTVTMFRTNLVAKQEPKQPESGLVAYMVRKSHIEAQVSGFSEPSRLDHFVDGADTYMVRDYSTDPLGRFWFLKCEKAALP